MIELLRQGDTQAFRTLVAEHQQRVMYICRSFVQNNTDAEDVAQEVFLEVFRSVQAFRNEATISTWLYRLAVNKSLDHLRQKKRKKRGFEQQVHIEPEMLERFAQQGGVHADLEENEKRAMLMAAIDQLPERQKVAVMLSKIDELSQKEVASIMNTSEGSIESLLVRAKRKLFELLEKHKKQLLY